MNTSSKDLMTGLQEGLESTLCNSNLGTSERLISVVSGGMLLLGGVRRLFKKPKSAFIQVAAGSALLLRGATGYCPLKQAMDPDYPQEKITIIESRN